MEEALNDPEGHALVEKILDPANPRLRRTSPLQVMVNGRWKDAGSAGTLSLTPEEDLFWEEATLKTAEKISAREIPSVSAVRWLCKAPTEPVYPVGSNGWLMEQAESRIPPEVREHMREHNRKLAAKVEAKADAIRNILGIRGDNGSDNR